MLHWYIVYVRSASEHIVLNILEQRLDRNFFKIFIPRFESIFVRKNASRVVTRPLFPGYIFIESVLNDLEFNNKTKIIFRSVDSVVRLLKYDENLFAMNIIEKQVLEKLLDEQYCIRLSYCYKEGDKVVVIKGPLKGLESSIVKINAHKRKATLALNMFGQRQLVKIGLECVQLK